MADLKDYITGLTLFLLVIGLFSIAIADHSVKYNTTLNSKINNSITSLNSQFQETVDISSDTYNTTTTTEASQTTDTGIDPKKSLSAVKNSISNMITVTITMGTSLADIFKIPTIAIQAMVFIMVFALTVLLLSLVFKIKP